MLMVLQREDVTDLRAIGRLFVDHVFVAYTLEDPPRGLKIPTRTAIPAGLYHVEVTYSPRFGRLLPILLDVPGFTGIRIHPGNKSSDTDGCILVGRRRGEDVIYESRLAFESLFPTIEDACRNEGCSIDVRNPLVLQQPAEVVNG